MNNFDKLDRTSGLSSTENKVVSVIEPENEPQTKRLKKANILSAFLVTIKKDDDYVKSFTKSERIPRYSYTIRVFFLCLAFLLLGTIVNVFLPALTAIPVMLCFCPLIVPVLILVFLYETNVDGKVNFFQTSLFFLGGIVAYIATRYLSDTLLVKIILESQIESYVMPFVSTLLAFVVCFFVVSANKTSSLGQCFLIVAAFSLGSVYAEQLVKGFERLFITEQLSLSELQTPFVQLIVNNDEYLRRSLSHLFDGWLESYVAYPFLNGCWAVVGGTVVSMGTEFKERKSVMPQSVYLLLALTIIFKILFLMETSIISLDVTLKLITFLVSTGVAVKLLDYSYNY